MSKPVPWDTFLFYAPREGESRRETKFSPGWSKNPANVTSTFSRGDSYCRLCDSYFADQPSEHVAVHAVELNAYLASRRDGRVEHSRSAVERQQRQQRTCELYEQGMTLTEIGEQLGISYTQVRRDLGQTP